MIYKIFIFSIILFGIEESIAQTLPESVTLEEALVFGLENNRNIINAGREVQRAYKEKWSVVASGLPQISASADYKNFIELPTSLVPAEFFGGKEGQFAEVQFGTPQNLSAGVILEQLIFDGSYFIGLESIKIFTTISENILEKTVLEIKKNIVSTYSSVLLIRENIRFLEKNIASLRLNLNELVALYENGFKEEESVEQLRLTLAEVETQLRYAQNTERITLDMLKLLLGFPTNSKMFLKDSLENLTTESLFNLQTNKSLDYTNNIDIKIAENTLLQEGALYKYELSKNLPRLSAFLSGNYTGNSDRFSFAENDQKWFGTALFGINLQVPIFSSFMRLAQSQKAKIKIEQAQSSLEETQERVYIEVQAAKNEYQLSVETYFTNKGNLALATRIEKKNQLKYFEGISSSFELRQAQLQMYGAQNNYIKAIQNVIQKKINLETLLNSAQ